MGNMNLAGHGVSMGVDSVSRVGAGMQPEYLVGGFGEMDERLQRKRSGSMGKGLGDKLDMSHEVRR